MRRGFVILIIFTIILAAVLLNFVPRGNIAKRSANPVCGNAVENGYIALTKGWPYVSIQANQYSCKKTYTVYVPKVIIDSAFGAVFGAVIFMGITFVYAVVSSKVDGIVKGYK
jgi:hypothetical protein